MKFLGDSLSSPFLPLACVQRNPKKKKNKKGHNPSRPCARKGTPTQMFEDGFSQEELSPLCGLSSTTEEGLGMFDLDFFRNESLWCAFPNVVTGASTFWDVTVRPAVSSVNPTTTLRTNKKKINLVVAVGLFTKLPDELIIAILSYLNVHELLTVGLVSKTFSALSKDDQIWRVPSANKYSKRVL